MDSLSLHVFIRADVCARKKGKMGYLLATCVPITYYTATCPMYAPIMYLCPYCLLFSLRIRRNYLGTYLVSSCLVAPVTLKQTGTRSLPPQLISEDRVAIIPTEQITDVMMCLREYAETLVISSMLDNCWDSSKICHVESARLVNVMLCCVYVIGVRLRVYYHGHTYIPIVGGLTILLYSVRN
ncbi:hypothetical protein F4779DRAFT_85304 [Xylariaceae sp. FL0662B]|nr:hypothetical protein F4779DRAFT_85304 [Xylariaceae sp. FL0662B]